jgi:glutathione S-transferase
MLKIYGQARSRTYRVIWLCVESNIPFEHDPITIHVPDATAKTEWYRALNPNARIPTIDDDGFVMWESAAINLYLARKYKSPLWPDTVQGEGRALQWSFFVANDVELPMVTIYQNRTLLPPERRDAALADRCDEQIKPKLAVLEAHLAANKYFGIDKWDLADFMVASVTYSLIAMKYDLANYPKFAAWLAESVARPGSVTALKYRA